MRNTHYKINGIYVDILYERRNIIMENGLQLDQETKDDRGYYSDDVYYVYLVVYSFLFISAFVLLYRSLKTG